MQGSLLMLTVYQVSGWCNEIMYLDAQYRVISRTSDRVSCPRSAVENNSPGETKTADLGRFGALSGCSLLSVHVTIGGELLTVVGHVRFDTVAMCCTSSSTSSSSSTVIVGLGLVGVCLLVA